MITPSQSAFKVVEISSDRARIERDTTPRHSEDVSAERREQFAQVEDALPQARLGM
jgi:hypothetical protein